MHVELTSVKVQKEYVILVCGCCKEVVAVRETWWEECNVAHIEGGDDVKHVIKAVVCGKQQ